MKNQTTTKDEPHICSPSCRGPGDPDTHGYPGEYLPELSNEQIARMEAVDGGLDESVTEDNPF